MVANVSGICAVVDKIAPVKLATDWDNVGLLVGDGSACAKRVLLALDVTEAVIAEAIEKSCDVIITHHPLIFKPVYKITTDNPHGRKLIKLIENKISLISAHTNLDMTKGGINDRLAVELGLDGIEILDILGGDGADSYGIGRAGYFKKEIRCGDVVKRLKEILKLDYAAVYGDCDKKITKVSLCSGSGMSYVKAAIKNKSDVYITSDITYHDAQDAIETGLTLIDITHYAGEVFYMKFLAEKINAALLENNYEAEVLVTETNGQIQRLM